MKLGSLFSGAGGLDMAVEAVFGARTVWHCEIDPAASKVLAHRFPGVPNHHDITAVDWAAVEPVDILCGGFPCQDVSSAGKRAGIKDGTRSGLWAMYADVIDALRPSIVVIENVRGLLSARAHRAVESDNTTVGDDPVGPVLRAAGAVLGDLADLGYDAQWTTFAASHVGAPHRRERVFILATDTANAERRRAEQQHLGATSVGAAEPRERFSACAFGGRTAADSSRDGRHEGRPEPARLVGGSDAALSGDGPRIDALLPTPNAHDYLASPTHARGNPTLKGALCGMTDAAIARHAKQGRHISGDGPVDLLPTPNAQDGNGGKQRSPEALARGDRQTNLTDLPRLLPTPTSRDHKGRNQRGDDTCLPGALLQTPSVADACGGHTTRSGKRGNELLLPTPNAQDGNGGGRYNSDGHQSTLPGDLLPTPRSSDCFGAGLHGDGGMDLRTTVIENATQWGKYEPAIRRWEQRTRSAPSPTEPNRNGNPRLNAEFSSWLMGWPAGWVTQVPGVSRNDALRIVGNGVCPQQATTALRWLFNVAA